MNPAGCELEVEIRARHKNRNYFWILDKGRVAERSPDGSPLRVVGSHLDITPRKQAENDLRASEVRFRTLVEHLPTCIHEIDLAGRLGKGLVALIIFRKTSISRRALDHG